MKNSCLAILIAFLLVIFLGLFIIATQIKTLTNPEFLTSTISQTQVLTNLSKSLDTTTLSQNESGQSNLNTTALTKVIIKSIDPKLAEKELNKAILSLLDYVQGRSKTVSGQIDLSVWKTSLNQQWPTLAPGIFRAEYENLLACAEGVKPNKLVGETIVIDCKSPELSADNVEQLAKTADLAPIMKLVPDQYPLSDLVKKNQAVFDKIKLGFNVLNLVFWLGLVLSILSIAGLTALGWPNWRAICGWNGWSMFIAAAPVLTLELLSKNFISLLQPLLATKLAPSISQITMASLDTFNRASVQATIAPVAIILGICVILIILSFVLPKYEQKITPPGFTPLKTPEF